MTEVAVVADVAVAAAELFIESVGGAVAARSRAAEEIGRASCRERV